MHDLLHQLANVGMTLLVMALLFMAVLNWRIAVQLPLFTHGLFYLERQSYARSGAFGLVIQREARWAYAVFLLGTLMLWPDIVLHLWYMIGKLF
mgnify:CR=1 FL=1